MKISITAGVGLALALTVCLVPHVSAQETGDLKIRFEYGGNPPKVAPVNVTKDTEFCGKTPLVNERLLVNPKNKGIENVVVYVYTGRGGSKLDKSEPAKAAHTLANVKCRFQPHVVIAQVGDTLEVTNPDPVGHNANLNFFNNRPENFLIAAGQSKSVDLQKDEPAPIPVDCNIHPWMKSYIVVLDHPFAALSNGDGELVVKGLPVGEDLVFRVWHESGSISDVTVDGKKEQWNRSRFETKIEAGMNDMGTVVILADALSAE